MQLSVALVKSESEDDAAPVASSPLYFIATVASFSVIVTDEAPVSSITLLLQSYAIDISNSCARVMAPASVESAIRREVAP
jgi:hypothetical protein